MLNNAIFNKFNIPNTKIMNKTSSVGSLDQTSQLGILNSIPKKKIKTIHEYSRVGFSGYGVKKVNQDNFFVFKNFVSNPNHIYMAVW
jgi:hypothetical protein